MNNYLFFQLYNLAHLSSFFDRVVVFIAVTFPYIVLLLALIFLNIYYKIFTFKNPIRETLKHFKELFIVVSSVVVAWIIADILKILLKIPRPFVELTNVHSLFPETSYAFPSGHATAFMSLAVALFFINKKVGYYFIFFAVLIGFARVIAGVHFPLDILGGFILGAFISIFFHYIFRTKKIF